MGPRKRHVLGRNDTTRTPPAVAVLATAPGSRPPDANGEQPGFRWHLTAIARAGQLPGRRAVEHHPGTDRDDLGRLVDELATNRNWTWLYAHGLAVHLSSSGLLDRLTAHGWVPLRNALDGPAPYVELGHTPNKYPSHSKAKAAYAWHEAAGIPLKDCLKNVHSQCPYQTEATSWQRHLIIADAGAVWPRTTTDDLARSQGIPVDPLPAADDDSGWAGQTRHDATVVLKALVTCMDWWDANDGGNWAKTGASTGWNSMRHRMSRETTVIDVTHPATVLERNACHGGRRTLFRFGQAPPGTYEELDFYRAYTIVARDMLLPTGRRASFTSLPLDHITVTEDRGSVGLIAEVTISRGEGRFPYADGTRVWYPDGRFTTVLAGPDIREAARLGLLESIGPGTWYTMGHTMAPWAKWCIEQQEDPGTPPVVVRMLKHHGRAVIGKTAGHAYAHDDLGPAHHLGFKSEPTIVGPDRKTGWVIDLGGKRTLTYQDGEADESFPAILAYVESHVRVMLSRVIDALGTAIPVQADTDGLIVSADALRTAELPALPDVASPGMPFRPTQVIKALSTLCAPLTVREKTIAKSFIATGPQHYQLGPARKRAGIPGNARPDGKGNLIGHTYPSLMEQASRGQPDRYKPQPWAGKDPPCVTGRWVLDTGRTVAPETAITAAGDTVILPWAMTVYYRAGLELGPTQDAVLERVAKHPGLDAAYYPWAPHQITATREEYQPPPPTGTLFRTPAPKHQPRKRAGP